MLKVPCQNRVGKCLREARKKRRLTQCELADQASLSVPTLRLLEGGRGNLSSWSKALSALSLVVEGRNLPPGEAIGHRIAALRKKRQVSQRKLAELARTTPPTIVALEKRSQGRLTVLDRVLVVLGSGHYLAEAGVRKDFYSHTGNSSTGMNWQTPRETLEILYAAFGTFDLDPCSPTKNRTAPVKASVHFTEADDGLSLPWHGTVFVNPPYGRTLKAWVAKAKDEVLRGNARTVVALVPARTDTRYWHEHVAGGNATVFFLRGRLTFGSADAAAPFPSAIVLWGPTDRHVAALEQALPDAWKVPPAALPPTSPLPPSEP